MSFARFLIFGIICLYTGFGFAQQYNFINYSIEEGLAQSQVNSIIQDNEGYLWVATLGGLSRFDSHRFKNYSTENGLLDNETTTLFKDYSGNIWIGTTGGIIKWDGLNFVSYRFPKNYELVHVISIALDLESRLILGTDGAGIFIFDTGKFLRISKQNGLPDDYVRAIVFDTEKSCWIGTRKGLCKLNGNKIERFNSSVLDSLNISSIIAENENTIWIATLGEGLFKLKGEQLINLNVSHGLISDHIRAAYQDTKGNIWIATKVGICKFDGTHFQSFTKEDGLKIENTKTIYQDVESNIWIGTDGGGIFRFNNEGFINYTTKDGIASNIIMGITQDKNSNYWYSSYGQGVIRFDGKSFTNFTSPESLKNGTVWTSFVDSSNHIWFGTSEGISEFFEGKFKNYGIAEGMPFNKITAITQISKSTMWFGGIDGISFLENGQFGKVDTALGFVNTHVRHFYTDKDKNIWIATKNGPVTFANNKFTYLADKFPEINTTIINTCQDFKGNFWFGTDNGIIFYDGKSCRNIKISDQYGTNFINFILNDSNLLWIGTDKGIHAMNLAKFYENNLTASFIHYSTNDGLMSMECNQNAAYKDNLGNLWFGTNGSLVKYQKVSDKGNDRRLAPYIHITGIRLFMEDSAIYKYFKKLDITTGLPINLSLPYNQNHLTFDFTGINLSNPDFLKYQYILENFDQTWVRETEANFATYSNLPYGAYIFKVKAKSKEGVWSEESTFSFEIKPPYYLTWWFFLLVILVLISSIYGIIKVRSQSILREKETEGLKNKAKMLSLEQQTLNASMNRHFIFNALNSIQFYINTQDKKSANQYLSDFARLVRKNLDSSQTNLVYLYEELERLELYLSLEKMRFPDKFSYKLTVSDDLDMYQQKIPSMLLQPFVENSIWHGILPSHKPGVVTIEIQVVNDDDILFIIEDNGIGVNNSLKNKNGHLKSHVSKGMEITRNRIELLRKMTNQNFYINGPFEVYDSNNEVRGTRVEIMLPCDLENSIL